MGELQLQGSFQVILEKIPTEVMELIILRTNFASI